MLSYFLNAIYGSDMSYEINYPKMIDDALHEVVKGVLRMVSKEGLKDGHHFFISFITEAPGVKLSNKVKLKYPEEITIVVQYQFDDLKVENDKFSLVLSFDGIEERVVVPYAAMTAFSDPLEKISFQFHYYQNLSNAKQVIDAPSLQEEEIERDLISTEDAVETSNVIQLDKFRSASDKK